MTDSELKFIEYKVRKILFQGSEPLHNLDHALRVRKNALKIVEEIKAKENIDMNLLQAACLLHDVPISFYKLSLINHFLEDYLVKKKLPEILREIKINQNDKKILIQAILNHNLSYPYRNLNKKKDIYSKILQDADTLDLFSNDRVEMFRKNKNNGLFYKLASPLASLYFNFGRSHIKWFLNFPQLSNEN